MEERTFEQDKMTLSYALIADGGIILAADSQVTHTHTVPKIEGPRIVGTYEGERSKIRRLGNHSAFSISGNSGLADTLLAEADLAGCPMHSVPGSLGLFPAFSLIDTRSRMLALPH